jgi:uncharacterized membrane protein YbaN (DUF454 family)
MHFLNLPISLLSDTPFLLLAATVFVCSRSAQLTEGVLTKQLRMVVVFQFRANSPLDNQPIRQDLR